MDAKKIGIGILVLAIIGVAAMQFGNMGGNTSQSPQPTSQISQEATDTAAAGTSEMTTLEYKDGEYTATGNYTSPAQEEEVDITITLANGVVTAAAFEGKATNETSQKLQGQFSEGFEEQVIGKPIDEIALTVVNGSSLTPKGFMDALEKIKTEAQS